MNPLSGNRSLDNRDAWAEVDLAVIVENARVLASLVPAGTRLAPVVKAEAYGHGAAATSLVLEAVGLGLFCVATIDEGLALRDAGLQSAILVLYEPPSGSWSTAADAGLEIAVTSRPGLERAIAAASEASMPRVHLKIDTGMSRQGLLADDVAHAAEHVRQLQTITAGIWTHLRDGADTESSAPQLARFDAAAQQLSRAGLSAPRHVAASAAIMTGQGIGYEIVRPGLALFGMTPVEALAQGLSLPEGIHAALSVHARPVRLVRLPTGTPVGYGGTFVTERLTLLATLPLGYADGVFRSLSDGKWNVLVRGQRAPVVGRVSMDGITVDVTDVEGVSRADVFTVLGRQDSEELTANAMASAAGTIPQEIAVRLTARLPFLYRANG